MRVKAAIVAVMAVMLLASGVCLGPPVSAYVGTADHVNLVDTGLGNYTGASWKFTVDQPGFVALDASYWNLTVIAECLAPGTASNGSYTITVYISDGAHNASKSATVTTSTTGLVYGNLSWAPGDVSAYAQNATGSYYVRLLNATSVEKDAYAGTIAIAGTAFEGSMMSLIPLVISFVVVAFFLTFFGQISEMIGKGFNWRK